MFIIINRAIFSFMRYNEYEFFLVDSLLDIVVNLKLGNEEHVQSNELCNPKYKLKFTEAY